jgi:hypothetical protein
LPRSWHSCKVFPNEAHQRAKSLIASVVNWKQLSMFSKSVLQSETTWEKFHQSLVPKILLDTKKKGFEAVVKFFDSLPQLFCWWFAWLEQLVKVLQYVNLSIYWVLSQVSFNPLELFMENSALSKRLNWKYALPWQFS